jgi:two-component system alkaline phosphatase synthesis response regulator PhoP
MKRKILVVDDESDVRQFLKKRLERNNYTVITAKDGSECISKARSDEPDLILLDIVMPLMDGYDVIKELRSATETKMIPVIMHSVRKETKSIIKSLELGSVDYVMKPASFEQLLRVVKRYV